MITALREFQQRYLTRQTLRNWVLILVIFVNLAGILRNSIQGLENSLLMLMTMAGLVVGWVLAISPISIWKGSLAAFLLGLGILVIRVARLERLLLELFSALFRVSTATWRWIFQQDAAPELRPIQLGIAELGERIQVLGTRYLTWVGNTLQGKPYYDPTVTALFWGFLIWAIAVWAMWLIFRRQQPLLALLPLLGLSSLDLIYSGKTAYHLVPILAFTTALSMLVQHDAREKTWQEQELEYAGIIREKITGAALVVTLGITLFSMITPTFSIQRIAETIERLRQDSGDEDDLLRSLGLDREEDQKTVDIFENFQAPGLPNRHLIGSGPELSDQVVMTVQIQPHGELNQEPAGAQGGKYYWRGLTYDLYIGRGWVSRENEQETVHSGETTLSEWPENYQVIRQRVDYRQDLGGVMYTAGIPLSADEQFQVAWRVQDSEQNAFDIFGAVIQETSYLADSLYPRAGETELQRADQDYPQWIRERYLSLPDSVPERVHALARDLTATEPTPYDRAVAIELYLRQFPYNLDLPQPPIDQDLAEYFLFTAKQGYCDYYATTMVVLSRSAGLPARLVTGYLGGQYLAESNTYRVTADLAHAWVEIYFPEYGWIAFEPTGGRPPIDRPADAGPKFSDDYTADFDPLNRRRFWSEFSWFWTAAGIIGGVVLLAAFGLAADLAVLRMLPAQKLLPRLYRRIYRVARWMGFPSRPGDTPEEFFQRFSQRMKRYGKGSRREEWLMEAQQAFSEITEAYYRVLFSPTQGREFIPKDFLIPFQRLRLRFWYLWLLVKAHRFWLLRRFLWSTAPTISPDQIKQPY